MWNSPAKARPPPGRCPQAWGPADLGEDHLHETAGGHGLVVWDVPHGAQGLLPLPQRHQSPSEVLDVGDRVGASGSPAAFPASLAGLGIPDVGIHVLRHSAAAALIRSGASATAIQKILGHRSAAFTLTVYGHIFEEDFDLLAENLGELLSQRFPERFLKAARAYRARDGSKAPAAARRFAS